MSNIPRVIRRVVPPLALSVLIGMLAGCGAPSGDAPATRSRELAALEVLRDWDADRARAYEHGDVGALARLYEPGSRLRRSDIGVLKAYARRGLRVHGMSTQVLDVAVDSFDAVSLSVRVTDRLTHAWASTKSGAEVVLPVAEPARRRLRFVKRDEQWLLATATEVAD